jgi:hypothetical protein
VYLTGYYGAAAVGAFVPGEAWDAWGWDGVMVVAAGALAVAFVAGLAVRRWFVHPAPA